MKAIWGYTGHTSPIKSAADIKLFQEPVSVKQKFGRDPNFLQDYSNRSLAPEKQDGQTLSSFVARNINENNQFPVKGRHFPTAEAPKFRRGKVFLNVRGRLYETFTETLARFPNTLLGCFEKRDEYYDTQKQQYLFGPRNVSSFDAILFYYQSNGILCRPADVDKQTFYNEIRFFQLDENVIKLFLRSEGLTVQKHEETEVSSDNGVAGKIWNFLEYPSQSTFAQLFAMFSIVIICLSVVIFCGETLPSIRKNSGKKFIFNTLEIFCISWFTLEYLLRMIFSPNRKKFFLSAIGWIDVLTIVPFYVIIVIVEAKFDINHGKLCCIFRVLKLLRVFRVFKLSRYVQGMNILGQTLLLSAKELFFLVLCLLMLSVLFASLFYFADGSAVDTKIHSVPHGLWFTIISLTCVGYGDIVPVTGFGKLNASVCVLAGMIVISIPVPIIVRNFTNLYYDRKRKES